MFDEYEHYQGLVLRQLIVGAEAAVTIEPFVTQGRISSFLLNGKVGVFVKHSAKRLSPWHFTFHIDQIADLLDLAGAHFDSFVALVCGSDGFISLDITTLHTLVDFKQFEQAWIRVDRKPRSMYSISGNRGEMANKVARGGGPILAILTL
jgi:hypothetical protein